MDAATTTVFAILAVTILGAAFAQPSKRTEDVVIASAAILLIVVLDAAGQTATGLVSPQHPAARTAPGLAFWGLALCAALAVVNALQRRQAGAGTRLCVATAVAGAVAGLACTGALDDLSILREYEGRRDAFAREFARHGLLVMAAVGPALLIGTPLGAMAARHQRLRGAVFGVLNVLQTIPSIALFGALIAPLSALATAFPSLQAVGVAGIGFVPATLALILYALLPVVRNTEAGLRAVEPAVVEAARGMGFTSRQIFWRVQAPLGLPIYLAGVRIVMVQAIGLAVVAALIGAGGLGTFVFQGIGQYAIDLVLLGALPAILLALAVDLMLRTAVEVVASDKIAELPTR